jgi:hypothetical protein
MRSSTSGGFVERLETADVLDVLPPVRDVVLGVEGDAEEGLLGAPLPLGLGLTGLAELGLTGGGGAAGGALGLAGAVLELAGGGGAAGTLCDGAGDWAGGAAVVGVWEAPRARNKLRTEKTKEYRILAAAAKPRSRQNEWMKMNGRQQGSQAKKPSRTPGAVKVEAAAGTFYASRERV